MHKHLSRPSSTALESGGELAKTQTKRRTSSKHKRNHEKDSQLTKTNEPLINIEVSQDNIGLEEIPKDFYVNICTEGSRVIGHVAHLTNENNLERKLRPISGLRNRSNINDSFLKQTDLVKRITCLSSTLKWLDFSCNNLSIYPTELCKLNNLQSLNLSSNKLDDSQISQEFRNYDQLIEIILDSNCLSKIPKQFSLFNHLLLLSIRNNQLKSLDNLNELRKLRYLIADGNLIETLKSDHLSQLEKLEILHLKSNRISQIDTKLFKLHLFNLKQLDLSSNRLNRIPIELFMLPHMDMLNLSNNQLARLPQMPVTYRRATQMFQLDLSGNILTKFYDYLILLARNLDLSSNHIKYLNSNLIRKLSKEQIKQKILKLDGNPFEHPPLDVVTSGLREIKEYFEQEESNSLVKYVHGFKILLVGPSNSGKTSLAYSYEEFSQLRELGEVIFQNDEQDINDNLKNQQTVSKLVEIHELQLEIERDKETENSEQIIKYKMPISLFDLNGFLKDYYHLMHYFIDRTALVLFCIDANDYLEEQITLWLDYLLFKIGKKTSFFIVPVITKCDLVTDFNKIEIEIQKLLNNLVQSKLDQLKNELTEIQDSTRISPSLSDKLKHLANLYSSFKPDIHKKCLFTSSRTMFGIKELDTLIKQVVLDNQEKYFSKVNTSVPTLWLEVEKYLQSVYSVNNLQSSLSMRGSSSLSYSGDKRNVSICGSSSIFIDYNELKFKIISKFGMEHMFDEILFYLNSQGKLLWLANEKTTNQHTRSYQETNQLHTKIILKPNLLFDLLHVLFNKTQFEFLFKDLHLQLIRKRLNILPNATNEFYNNLVKELHKNGVALIDLFKIIWMPLLMTDSIDFLNEILLFLMYFFHIGYPRIAKHKLQQIFSSFYEIPRIQSSSLTQRRQSIFSNSSQLQLNIELDSSRSECSSNFEALIIPVYLPLLNVDQISLIRNEMYLNSYVLPKSDQKCIVTLKYSFCQTISCGLFERFSVNLLLNTNVYFKQHFRDAIHAFNEVNTIGCFIYNSENNIIFEFYLLNTIVTTSQSGADDEVEPLIIDSENQYLQFIEELWILIMKILSLFEEMLTQLPGIQFNRLSQCPFCNEFSFLGEWQTPKE